MNREVIVAGPGVGPATLGRPAGDPPKVRVALYSHDTMGIGHMRRHLLIAGALAGGPSRATVLLIAGAREVNAYGVPAGGARPSLPPIREGGDGRYHPRRPGPPPPDLIAVRARSIAGALEAFTPDVLIVDKVPRGAVNELEPALQSLRHQGRTRCVLGLRDVLDDPATVRREWSEAANDQAVRDHYHAVWVYGDPAVCDAVAEYAFPPEVAARVRYTGYLDQRRRIRLADIDGARGVSARLAESP